MASNDSDSSDDENQDFTTTNVLLGFASTEPTDDSFSQLGGYPTWLNSKTYPSATLARCKVCQSMMTLILQLNGDLPERFPSHERRLYIFVCKSHSCRRKQGSIRAIRGTRASNTSRSSNPKKNHLPAQEAQPQKQPAKNLGSILFNSSSSPSDNSNPFSSPQKTISTSNPFSKPLSSDTTQRPSSPISHSTSSQSTLSSSSLSQTFAQKARLNSPPPPSSPPSPWPPTSDLPPPFPAYHLDADFEILDTPSFSTSTPKIPLDENPSNEKDPDEASAFESPSLDKTFRRFADRLAQNPLQVLRYEFAGSPLLYSKSDAVGRTFATPSSTSNKKITMIGSGIPACAHCASPRVFELQLTPQAIAELEVGEMGLEGMEWGSVIVGVCEADCVPGEGDVSYVEEWVGVQWEDVGGGGR